MRGDALRQAVILVGGRGQRLRPLTDQLPKPLVAVAGRPFLEYLFSYLRRFGIEDIILCSGYLAGKIEAVFGNGSRLRLKIRYSREKTPRGTGGALKLALPHLAETFFLINGDTLLPADYQRLWDAFSSFPGEAVLSAQPAAGPDRPGNLSIAPDGRVLEYRRRAPGREFSYVDAGVGVFRREVARYFPEAEVFSLEEEVYPRLIREGLLGAWVVDREFYDIGTPGGLRRFEDFVRGEGRSLFPLGI